jgi:hypothetical protein
VQLPGEPSDVGSSRDAEVAQDEVSRIRADPRQGRDVLTGEGEQPTELGLATSCSNALAVCDSTCS